MNIIKMHLLRCVIINTVITLTLLQLLDNLSSVLDYSRAVDHYFQFSESKELRSGRSGAVFVVSIEAPLILGNAINYI